MFTISKRFSFAASHVLHGLPTGHKCGRLHGHNYGVELILVRDELDSCGFVLDYGKLVDVGRHLTATFDHRHLNDLMTDQPSAENLAFLLYETFHVMHPALVAVRVSETADTWAEYRR